MSGTLYHNPKCSKSRQTLQLLEKNAVHPEIILYLENPPSIEELTEILEKLDMKPEKLLRKKEAKEYGLLDEGLSDEAIIAGMVANPRAIERPIYVNGDKARLGRPPEKVLEII